MKENKLEEWIRYKLKLDEKLARENIEKKQLENLNKTIKIAKRSSFYREHLKGIEILNSLKDIKDIPFIDELDIKNYHNKMLAVSQEEISKISTMETSGTTGDKKRIYFTDNDLESIIDFFHNGLSQFIKSNTKTLILMPSRVENSIGDLVSKGIDRIGSCSIKYGLLDDFNKDYEKLKYCDYIIGMPIQVLNLGRYLEYKKLDIDIKGILLSADNGSEKTFKEIEEIYNCKVYNHYGITEGGLGVAVECDCHCGMHPRELDIYLEIIDEKTGKMQEDGKYGEVVLTTLTREGMPIIRYRTGDISRFIVGECHCKAPFRRLDNIIGRKEDLKKININELDNKLYVFKSLMDYRLELKDNQKSKMILRFLPINIPSDEDIREILYMFGIDRDIELIIDIGEEYVNLHGGKRKIYY